MFPYNEINEPTFFNDTVAKRQISNTSCWCKLCYHHYNNSMRFGSHKRGFLGTKAFCSQHAFAHPKHVMNIEMFMTYVMPMM